MFSFRFAIETIRYRSFIIVELVLSLTSLALLGKVINSCFYTVNSSLLCVNWQEEIRYICIYLYISLTNQRNKLAREILSQCFRRSFTPFPLNLSKKRRKNPVVWARGFYLTLNCTYCGFCFARFKHRLQIRFPQPRR